jgi:hypothetical protein
MTAARVRLSVALALIAIVVGILGTYGPPPPATAQTGLFTPTTRQPGSRAATVNDPSVVRSRAVEVNFGLIDGTPRAAGSLGGAGATLTLNLFPAESTLFPDVTITAIRDRVEPAPSGTGYVWVGHAQGANLTTGLITLAVENGVMVGNIRANGSFYHIRFADNGVHLIQEINERALPGEHAPHPPLSPADVVRARALANTSTPSTAPSTSGTRAATAAIIDVLIVYTANFAAQEGGNISGLFSTGIVEANQAYANSNIGIQLRLASTLQLNYASQGGDLSADLKCVSGQLNPPSCPGQADTVATERDKVGADLVSLWVEGTGSCPPGTSCFFTTGQAFVMNRDFNGSELAFAPYAYSVVMGRFGTAPSYTFAHEIGHNLGANHDHATDDRIVNSIPPYTPWAYDYVATDLRSYRTIMAYACGGTSPCNVVPPIVLYLSNPNILPPEPPINGRPIGVPQGQPGQADNASVLNVTGPKAQFFRACPPTSPSCTPQPVPTAVPPPQATPTVTGGCAQRPTINVITTPTGSQLNVTVAGTRNARILRIIFGETTNALITMPAGSLVDSRGNTTVTLPPETVSANFSVRRAAAGQSSTVNLVVEDGCGRWPTFVGGGPNAGF